MNDRGRSSDDISWDFNTTPKWQRYIPLLLMISFTLGILLAGSYFFLKDWPYDQARGDSHGAVDEQRVPDEPMGKEIQVERVSDVGEGI